MHNDSTLVRVAEPPRRRSPVFRISKPLLSKFITHSRRFTRTQVRLSGYHPCQEPRGRPSGGSDTVREEKRRCLVPKNRAEAVMVRRRGRSDAFGLAVSRALVQWAAERTARAQRRATDGCAGAARFAAWAGIGWFRERCTRRKEHEEDACRPRGERLPQPDGRSDIQRSCGGPGLGYWAESAETAALRNQPLAPNAGAALDK